MTGTKQRYVRNTRTGVIFPFTDVLAKHKNCVVLSLELGAEYDRRAAEGPAAVQDMERRLLEADKSGEVISSSELADTLANTPVSDTAPPVALDAAPGVTIPDDFDLDVDISTLSKPELAALGARINLAFPGSMKVGAMRDTLAAVLEEARLKAAAADGADDLDPLS